MARTQANIYLTIWTDIDFRQLSTDAQWLYFTMLTHETLNYCGVMDWRPARLAALNDDMTIPRIQQAAWDLGQKRLIAVDPETEEALVRSFVRHDGVLKYPNTTKGLVRQYGGIASMMILELVALEVGRAIKEQPELKGVPIAEQVAKQFTEPKTNPSDWVPKWFQNTSNKDRTGMGAEKGEPIKSGSPTLTLTTTSSNEENYAEPPKKRNHPLPPDWQPTKEHIDRANEDQLNLANEVAKFKAHALEKGRTAKSWNGAFTRWLINSAEYKQERQQARAAPRADRATQTYLADAARYAAQEQNEGGYLAIGQ